MECAKTSLKSVLSFAVQEAVLDRHLGYLVLSSLLSLSKVHR